MSATDSSHQQKADDLLRSLESFLANGRNIDNYDLPEDIDYKYVSEKTATNIFRLIARKTSTKLENGAAMPKTPRRMRIARRIDYVLARRRMDTAQRIEDAQRARDQLDANLGRVYEFLWAARQPGQEVDFPVADYPRLVDRLAKLRKVIGNIEKMAKSALDGEATDPESDGEWDGDLTFMDVPSFA
ncbi:hypothetical protein C8R47DRAFT_1303328 [Mycena vitilis]|nr:hypothetical protein C8R47DRAFT_1303328 [Mycena vitilis]